MRSQWFEHVQVHQFAAGVVSVDTDLFVLGPLEINPKIAVPQATRSGW